MESQWPGFMFQMYPETVKRYYALGSKRGRVGELYYVDISERKKYQLTKNRLQEWGGVFSPDEKWLAYTSEKDMEGSFAIYLNRFPEMNQEIRISVGGGEEPKWLPDGSSCLLPEWF